MTRFSRGTVRVWILTPTARFNSRYIRTTIVQVYCPINDADEEVKGVFDDKVHNVIAKISKHYIALGDGECMHRPRTNNIAKKEC